MPRYADPKSKTLRLILQAKPSQEDKIRAFKELCARNQLTISNVLFEKVEEFLKQHNWPPGNSQTILPAFLPHGIEAPKKPVPRRPEPMPDYASWTQEQLLKAYEKSLPGSGERQLIAYELKKRGIKK